MLLYILEFKLFDDSFLRFLSYDSLPWGIWVWVLSLVFVILRFFDNYECKGRS